MVVCPVAIAVGCKKCPIFNVCPVKSVIGDQQAAVGTDEQSKSKSASAKSKKH